MLRPGIMSSAYTSLLAERMDKLATSANPDFARIAMGTIWCYSLRYPCYIALHSDP